MVRFVPPPSVSTGGFCGRVVIAIAAAFCSNVSVLIDGIRKLTSPVLSCWYFSVVIPRQRRPLL